MRIKAPSRMWLTMPFSGALIGFLCVWSLPNYLPQASISTLTLQYVATDTTRPLSVEELNAEAKALASAPPIAGLSLSPDAKAQRIKLELTSDDAGLAAGILTRLAEAYAAKTQSDVPEFLSIGRDLAQHQRILADQEAELEKLSHQKNQLEANGKLDEVKKQIDTHEARAAQTRSQAAAIRRAMDAGTLAAKNLKALKTDAIQALWDEREGLLADIENLTAITGSDDPGVLDLRFQLKNLDRKMAAQAERIAVGLEAEARGYAKRAADLKSRLGALAKSEEIGDQQSDLLQQITKRKAEIAQLLEKFASHQAAGPARFGVSLAGPVSIRSVPQTIPTNWLGYGLGGGFVLGLLLAALSKPKAKGREKEFIMPLAEEAPSMPAPKTQSLNKHSTDWEQTFSAAARLLADTEDEKHVRYATIQEHHEMENATRQHQAAKARFRQSMQHLPEPILPSRNLELQMQGRQPELPVHAAANDLPIKRGEVLNSELRRITAWVLGLIDTQGLPVLGISGIDAQSGDAAALATDLARVMAGQLPRVLLLDASPMPQHLEICMPPAARTLGDFLGGRASLSEVIARDSESGLHWIAGTKGGAGARIEGILQALSAGYDMLIVHTGAYKMAESRALMGCQAIAIAAPMIQALAAREVMEGLHQAGIAHTEFAASSGTGNNSQRGVWAA